MATDKTKNRTIKLNPPSLTSVPIYYINRFKIERDGAFRIIYLGCVIAGELMNSSVVAMAESDVLNCYQSSKTYITALGSVSQEPPKDWNKPVTNKAIFTANILNLSKAGATGEIYFSNYLIHEFANNQKSLQPEPLIIKHLLLFRSDLEFHKQFIGNLFDAIE